MSVRQPLKLMDPHVANGGFCWPIQCLTIPLLPWAGQIHNADPPRVLPRPEIPFFGLIPPLRLSITADPPLSSSDNHLIPLNPPLPPSPQAINNDRSLISSDFFQKILLSLPCASAKYKYFSGTDRLRDLRLNGIA